LPHPIDPLRLAETVISLVRDSSDMGRGSGRASA
jgi:hypothetical protein